MRCVSPEHRLSVAGIEPWSGGKSGLLVFGKQRPKLGLGYEIVIFAWNRAPGQLRWPPFLSSTRNFGQGMHAVR